MFLLTSRWDDVHLLRAAPNVSREWLDIREVRVRCLDGGRKRHFGFRVDRRRTRGGRHRDCISHRELGVILVFIALQLPERAFSRPKPPLVVGIGFLGVVINLEVALVAGIAVLQLLQRGESV